jgi:hypothetical protein
MIHLDGVWRDVLIQKLITINKMEKELECNCECHLGGAVSCPSCKDKHDEGIKCEHCK